MVGRIVIVFYTCVVFESIPHENQSGTVSKRQMPM